MKLLLNGALVLAVAAGAMLVVVGRRSDTHEWEVLSANASGNTRIAFVRGTNCGAGVCQTIWIGPKRETAALVSTLAPGTEGVDEIAWTNDGKRVAFLVNGYQLRLFDGESLAPAGQFSLITPDGVPSSRIARGVTFSENGRAVTFDDCPRYRSGCRAGLVAVPQ
jgi:hypothetical protein